MAERNYSDKDYADCRVITWSGLLNGDFGTPVGFMGSGDKSVQFSGTFGVGGTIVLEGTLDGTNYHTLSDLQTTAISKTAAALEGIAEAVLAIRPRVTGGDGSTNLVATLLVRP